MLRCSQRECTPLHALRLHGFPAVFASKFQGSFCDRARGLSNTFVRLFCKELTRTPEIIRAKTLRDLRPQLKNVSHRGLHAGEAGPRLGCFLLRNVFLGTLPFCRSLLRAGFLRTRLLFGAGFSSCHGYQCRTACSGLHLGIVGRIRSRRMPSCSQTVALPRMD